MIITNTQLNEIERHVGRACQVGIVLGNPAGTIISVSAKKESGEIVCYEEMISPAQILNNDWQAQLHDFKHQAKLQFDSCFEK